MNKIYNIVAGFFIKSNTESEKEKLREWLNESDANLKLFAEISDYEKFEKWGALVSHFEKQADWKDISLKTFKRRKNRVLSFSIKVAAILIIPITFLLLIKSNSHVELRYNTIVIPKSAQHFLILSDGTKVWLNSKTRFTYPENFSDNIREVSLEGEAFFEVAKGGKAPFVVKAGIVKIVVVGTEFNVKAYEQEKLFRVTLNKGKLKVCLPTEEIVLTQNQLAWLTEGQEISVDRNIDASIYSAWKDEMLSYKDQKFKSIAEDLERQYNVKIKCGTVAVEEVRFSIYVKKFNSISELLELLKETGKIDYEIINDTILIKEGPKLITKISNTYEK